MVRANKILKVLRETPLLVRRPMKDSEKILRETPLIFRFSIKEKDSEKTYIWKIKRGLPRGASIIVSKTLQRASGKPVRRSLLEAGYAVFS